MIDVRLSLFVSPRNRRPRAPIARAGLAALIGIGAIAGLQPLPAHALRPAQIFEKAAPSVVMVTAHNKKSVSQGSGVVIQAQRVITNCHVLGKHERLVVKSGKSELPATLEYMDADRDLCQLVVPGLRAPVVSTRKLSTVKVGEYVYAIGNPEGLERTLTEGLVSAIRNTDGRTLIQTNASVTHGSSGGGLFDERGKLIGITSSGVKEGVGLNFAVPADFIAGVASRGRAMAGAQPRTSSTQTAATTKPAETIAAKRAPSTRSRTVVAPVATAKPIPPAAAKPAAAEDMVALSNDGFPRRLNGKEITEHFARHRKIDAHQGDSSFTLKIQADGKIERYCGACRVIYSQGVLSVKREESQVCFTWHHSLFPDTGCFYVIQKNENTFLMRELTRNVNVMQYSIKR